jgi:adenosyl cobinamide kinase/adenosyl cobinamide phosphate guanylyltransferase
MILVVGGLSSGKRNYVISEYGYTENDISSSLSGSAPVLYDLQELVNSDSDAERIFPELLNKRVVICTDIGCGIVPLEPAEREKREAVGRLCIRLAKEAERVVRVQCGIPQVLKG